MTLKQQVKLAILRAAIDYAPPVEYQGEVLPEEFIILNPSVALDRAIDEITNMIEKKETK